MVTIFIEGDHPFSSEVAARFHESGHPDEQSERTRAKLEIQIERLRVLVSSTASDIPDLETTGAYVSAALKTLDRKEPPEPNEAESAWGLAALDAATLQGALLLQEAIACVELMRTFAIHVFPSVRAQMKSLAAEQGTTVQALVEDGINMVFEKYGKTPIA